MDDFNHLKNLCEFLDNASNFEHALYEANYEYDERLRTDPDMQYDEAESRACFGEHIFNLLVEMGADVEKEMAERLTDILVPAFYHVNDNHYKESVALQNMLRAAYAAVQCENDRMAAGDYSFTTFKIIIGDMSSSFILGGPQLDALYAFAQHIADENGYEINANGQYTTVEE